MARACRLIRLRQTGRGCWSVARPSWSGSDGDGGVRHTGFRPLRKPRGQSARCSLPHESTSTPTLARRHKSGDRQAHSGCTVGARRRTRVHAEAELQPIGNDGCSADDTPRLEIGEWEVRGDAEAETRFRFHTVSRGWCRGGLCPRGAGLSAAAPVSETAWFRGSGGKDASTDGVEWSGRSAVAGTAGAAAVRGGRALNAVGRGDRSRSGVVTVSSPVL